MDDAATGSEWSFRLASSLQADGQSDALMTPEIQGQVLRLAREVAHGSERFNAPLAAFLAGRFVERRGRQGQLPEAALDEVLRVSRLQIEGAASDAVPPAG